MASSKIAATTILSKGYSWELARSGVTLIKVAGLLKTVFVSDASCMKLYTSINDYIAEYVSQCDSQREPW